MDQVDTQKYLITNVFRKFLIDHLNVTPEFISRLLEIDGMDQVKTKMDNEGATKAICEMLRQIDVCENKKWYTIFVSALRGNEGNRSIADCIEGSSIIKDMKKYAKALRSCVFAPEFVKRIHPMDILPLLSCLDASVAERIMSRRGEMQYCALELLLNLPRSGNTWYDELKNALRKLELHELLQMLESNEDDEVVDTDVVVMYTERFQGHAATEAVSAETEIDGEQESMTMEVSGTELEGGLEQLTLRCYQKTLCQPVIDEKNTIIVSFTGSGKTIMAVHFIKKHFETKPEGKVLFLVNRTVLARQHHDLCHRYVEQRLGFMIGENTSLDAPLKSQIEGKDVLFLTAQILENALQNNELELKQFTMLIFDECHSCYAGDPYNLIMARYRKQKLQQQGARDNLPQIVGMTASVGTGKASSQEQADIHVATVFANLDIEIISVPARDDAEYISYENPPTEVEPIIVAPRSSQDNPFEQTVTDMMITIERIITESPAYKLLPEECLGFMKKDKGSYGYEHDVENLKTKSLKFITDPVQLRLTKTCCEHLRKYNDALKINEMARIIDAVESLTLFYDVHRSRIEGFNDIDKTLLKLFEDKKPELDDLTKNKQYENPMLTKLEAVLCDEFKKNPSSIAIIFCTKTSTVTALKKWIANNQTLNGFIKVEEIFGSSKLTAIEQKQTLFMFANGEYNVLVATNVLEEGVDIPACNLVIRYNYIGSDIGRVQARGRARHEHSKFFMIALSTLNFESLDRDNIIRNTYMGKATRKFAAMPPTELAQRFGQLQLADLNDRKRLEEASRESEAQRNERAYKLTCANCTQFATSSYNIKTYKRSNHFIVPTDREFYVKHIKVKPHHKSGSYDDIEKHQKMYCSKCSWDWGVIARINKMELAIIKITGFHLVEQATGKKQWIKKWVECPFRVEEVVDMVAYKASLPDQALDTGWLLK